MPVKGNLTLRRSLYFLIIGTLERQEKGMDVVHRIIPPERCSGGDNRRSLKVIEADVLDEFFGSEYPLYNQLLTFAERELHPFRCFAGVLVHETLRIKV